MEVKQTECGTASSSNSDVNGSFVHVHTDSFDDAQHILASEPGSFQDKDRIKASRMAGCIEIESSHLEIGKALGDGHFGHVYHAEWIGPDTNWLTPDTTSLAIKVPKHELRRGVVHTGEAAMLAQLSHKNVVKFHGICWMGKKPCLVTEYCERGSLKQCLKTGTKETQMACSLPWARDIVNGMAYLHHYASNEPIVHRDLKSLNVLVSTNNILKICDFGSSAVFRASRAMKTQMGTPAWMSPEMIRGDADKLCEKCDVWSFGVILWELLTREHPFDGYEEAQILWLVGNHRLCLPIGEVPQRFANVMRSCWEPEPSNRPSFLELEEKLRSESLNQEASSFLLQKEHWKPIMEEQLRVELEDAQRSADDAIGLANDLQSKLNVAQADVKRLRAFYERLLCIIVILLPMTLIFLSGDGLDNISGSAAAVTFKANAGDDSHLSVTELTNALSTLVSEGHISQDVVTDVQRIVQAYNWNAADGSDGLDETEFSSAIAQETSYLGTARRLVSRTCQSIFGTRLGSLGSLLREIKHMIGPTPLSFLGIGLLVVGIGGLYRLENARSLGLFLLQYAFYGSALFQGALFLSTATMENVSGFSAARNAAIILASLAPIVTLFRPTPRIDSSLSRGSLSFSVNPRRVSSGGSTNMLPGTPTRQSTIRNRGLKSPIKKYSSF
eukprot:m.128904 g.128904  ORF g.128904 m.128904 type:complete len:671 (-) comp14568_c0_seq2:1531-3543(-)